MRVWWSIFQAVWLRLRKESTARCAAAQLRSCAAWEPNRSRRLVAMEPHDIQRFERRSIGLGFALCTAACGFFGAFVMPSQTGLHSPRLCEDPRMLVQWVHAAESVKISGFGGHRIRLEAIARST
eukprot:g9256.t1